MWNRILYIILTICIITTSLPIKVNAKSEQFELKTGVVIDPLGGDSLSENNTEDTSEWTEANNIAAAVIVGSTRTAEDVISQHKFTQSQGHGFAAEQGNNFIDKIKGKNTSVIGENNAANGADRKIIGRDGSVILIQDKYCRTANESIDACFDKNGLKYIDSNGYPMQIEVPRDQYDDAILRMKQKIESGKVPGITDPEEAKNIVRKGHLTYNQAKNLAKTGKVDSLAYDAANGTVAAASAFGISTVLNYATLRINGVKQDDAIKESAIEGVKTGGSVFCVEIIAGQLTKSRALNIFTPQTEALTKSLGKDFSEKLLKAFGEDVIANQAESVAESATKQAARRIRAEGLVAVATIVVFSVPDAIDMFNGRVSKKQFVKNFAVIAASVVAGTVGFGLGGMAGSAVGSAVLPGAGTAVGGKVGATIGGLIGGTILGAGGGLIADKIADKVAEDDANEMYDILEEEYSQLCDDYLVSETEAQNIADNLGKTMTNDTFKDMYQSKDRAGYGKSLLEPLFEEELNKRETIIIPTEEEMRSALKEELEGVVFIH